MWYVGSENIRQLRWNVKCRFRKYLSASQKKCQIISKNIRQRWRNVKSQFLIPNKKWICFRVIEILPCAWSRWSIPMSSCTQACKIEKKQNQQKKKKQKKKEEGKEKCKIATIGQILRERHIQHLMPEKRQRQKCSLTQISQWEGTGGSAVSTQGKQKICDRGERKVPMRLQKWSSSLCLSKQIGEHICVYFCTRAFADAQENICTCRGHLLRLLQSSSSTTSSWSSWSSSSHQHHPHI